MKLLITRHGQTQGNTKEILAGIDDCLTLHGIEQAQRLSLRLKNEKLDAIYSSPVARSLETARIISKFHPNAKFYIADELREMDLGSYENKNWNEVDWENMPADVESRTCMFNRGKKIISRALNEYPQGTVLFVGHNAINKALIRVLRKLDPDDKSIITQKNTSLSIYELNNGSNMNCKEILFNCTKHLE